MTPPVEEEIEAALREALGSVPELERSAWSRTALEEAVERDEPYAFSPRRTRGATRA